MFINVQSGTGPLDTDPDLTYNPASNVLTVGGITTSSLSTFNGQTAFNSQNTFTGLANLKIYNETVVNPTIGAGNLTVDLSSGTIFNVLVNATVTSVTFSNASQTSAGNQASGFIIITNGSGSAYSIT